jgi:hypothetical protein
MAATISYEQSFASRLKQRFSCFKKPDDVKAPEELPADSKARQVQDLREFFRELGIYLLMLICFSLAIWLDSSSIQQHNLARIFMQVIKPKDSPTSVDAFYELLHSYQNSTGKCSGILCALTSTDYFAADSAGNQSSGGSIYLGSMLLGQIRLRQVRVQKAACSSFYQKLEDIDCYPEYAAGQEETTYTKDWAPDFDTSTDSGFKYQSQAETEEVGLHCTTRVVVARNAAYSAIPVVSDGWRVHYVPRQMILNHLYSCPQLQLMSALPSLLANPHYFSSASGFVVDFPTDAAAVGDRLAALRQANWIDIKTVRLLIPEVALH